MIQKYINLFLYNPSINILQVDTSLLKAPSTVNEIYIYILLSLVTTSLQHNYWHGIHALLSLLYHFSEIAHLASWWGNHVKNSSP
ncbi:hypothetical protein XELAEV_18027809mg [Xenopus laevis]|uniref:Uncharacterized protein n=1 Tax=Xenopus laevis TaxID=8355 RepID=A0A974CYS7_XENLA|nr:hypothetical protein XELAEV_18027809mg [Xenopus laevis]